MAPALTAVAPLEWNEIELLPVQPRLASLVLWLESILGAIEHDHGEPDTRESLYLACALGALVEGRHFDALRFTRQALRDPWPPKATILGLDGAPLLCLAEIRAAIEILKPRPGGRAPRTSSPNDDDL